MRSEADLMFQERIRGNVKSLLIKLLFLTAQISYIQYVICFKNV